MLQYIISSLTHASLILASIAVVMCFSIGLFVFSQNTRDIRNRNFFYFILASTAWGAALVSLRSGFIAVEGMLLFLGKCAFIGAAAVPAFLSLYLESLKHNVQSIFASTSTKIIFALFGLQVSVIIFGPFLTSINILSDGTPELVVQRYLHALYGIYHLVVFAIIYISLWRYFKNETTPDNVRVQLLDIVYATATTAALAFLFNFILPFLQIPTFNWFGPFGLLLLAAVCAYGMYEHRLFDIRLVSAQIITVVISLLAFLLFLQTDSTQSRIVGFGLFMGTIAAGIFLVRSVASEVTLREHAEELAKELESKNAELAHLNAQKSEFLSIATHQLRTPLGAMNGYTSLVLGGSFGPISDKIQEVLGKVLQSGMLMNGTIEDFLSVSRIDQGRMVYDMIDFPIQKLTKEVFEELKAGAERKGLTLKYEVPDADYTVHADYGKLKHVISNLVDNSIKYTREGWVRISAETVGGYVRVSVSDSGVGIPSDELPKLFDKFVRARGASGVNVSGTGLGLYVAKQMVEAHKGRVWAESAGEGKGSTFIAELPLAQRT